MENKKQLLFAALFLFLFSCTGVVFAQETNISSEEDEENISNEESDAQDKWQVLEWEEDNPEFVLKYEIVIQQLNEKNNSYTEINRLETQSNETSIQIKPLLGPGNYRYKVITYDLIGIAQVESEWFSFRIFKAFQPEISNISTTLTKSSTLYLEEFNDGIFTISGKNLFPEQQNEKEITFSSYVLEKNKKKNFVLKPEILETDAKNRHLKVQFNMKELDTGVYNFVVIDASGLKSESSKKNEITVKYKKAVDFDISAGYTVPIALYDDTFEKYLDTIVYPLSLDAKASLLLSKHSYGYFGFGLSAAYTRLYSQFSTYKIEGNMMSSHLNFIYQLPLRKNVKGLNKLKNFITLELHGGPGVVYLQDVMYTFENDIKSESLNSLNFSFDAGAAAQFYLTSRLFLEANIDFISPFLSDMALGIIQPSINIGWQF